jgi:acyl-CoA reductase-like NAD-dependent aldehyde dehydrogenase
MTQTLRKIHPATGAVLAELPCIDPQGVPDLVTRARRAQGTWAKRSPRERGRAVIRVAETLVEQADGIAALIASETGKPVVEGILHEILGPVNVARYFGKRAAKILKPRRLSPATYPHRRSYLHYPPRGVIGIIGPWNFPFSLTFGDVIMALVAGNGVVLKPSEHTPLSGLEVRRVVEAAGIDPELVQVAIGHGDVGAALVKAGVDMIHFTGSVATGRKVAAACGEALLPCVMELGGKDAAIVLDDADVEHAAQTLVYGAFANAGQACASVERVYALPEVYAPLVRRMVDLTHRLRHGNGSVDDVDVGPMIVPAQLEIVKRHVEQARAAGAKVETGGVADGPFYRPTVLTGVTDDMPVCRDETFGPVLPVMAVQSVDEAVERANDSIYGLSAYVFTRNAARGREVAERLRAGTVDVNEVLYTHTAPETPWGGVKASGIGHTHSDEGLRHMCEARHVNYSPFPLFINPWIYPYRRGLADASIDLLRGAYGARPLLTRARLLWRGLWGALRAVRAARRES